MLTAIASFVAGVFFMVVFSHARWQLFPLSGGPIALRRLLGELPMPVRSPPGVVRPVAPPVEIVESAAERDARVELERLSDRVKQLRSRLHGERGWSPSDAELREVFSEHQVVAAELERAYDRWHLEVAKIGGVS